MRLNSRCVYLLHVNIPWLLVLWLESPSQTEFSFVHMLLHCRKIDVSFSMAIGNEELMHECFPKHSRMDTTRMKYDKEIEEG